MTKSKGNRPAVADWDIGAAGARSTTRIYDVSESQRKDGTVVFRDAAGDVALVLSLAPGVFIQRRQRRQPDEPPSEEGDPVSRSRERDGEGESPETSTAMGVAGDMGIWRSTPMSDADAAEFRERFGEAMKDGRYQTTVLPPRFLTEDQVRQLLAECVTVVKPGETLVLRMGREWTPPQLREVADMVDAVIKYRELPFRALVVPADALGVATHEHEWTRCPNCPAGPDKPCACAGAPCCDQERAEIAAEREASGE